MSIPAASACPVRTGHRVGEIAPSPDTLVIVNCAGRTRIIIGTQSLVNAGIPDCGGGAAERDDRLDHRRIGIEQRADPPVPSGRRRGQGRANVAARAVADKAGVGRIDRATLISGGGTATDAVLLTSQSGRIRSRTSPRFPVGAGGRLVQA